MHPQVASSFKGYNDKDELSRIIDESQYDDMYELLAGMDAYITDYSSAVFEAGYAHIPAFIYADDIEDYGRSRGRLFWDFDPSSDGMVHTNKDALPNLDACLPFTVAQNNYQLEANIREFNQQEYDGRLDEFHEKIDLVFDGRASDRLARHILSIMEGHTA